MAKSSKRKKIEPGKKTPEQDPAITLRQDALLDEALEEMFPASDSVSVFRLK